MGIGFNLACRFWNFGLFSWFVGIEMYVGLLGILGLGRVYLECFTVCRRVEKGVVVGMD